MRKTARVMNEIMWAAPLVIGMRLSRLMLPDAMRTSADKDEDSRMVAEKAAAAMNGVVAAQTELVAQMMSAWTGLAFGRLPNSLKMADAVTAAALKPARKKVKANARRLSRKSRS